MEREDLSIVEREDFNSGGEDFNSEKGSQSRAGHGDHSFFEVGLKSSRLFCSDRTFLSVSQTFGASFQGLKASEFLSSVMMSFSRAL